MSTDAHVGVVRNINAGRNINEGVPHTSRKLSLLKSHQMILVVLVVVAAGIWLPTLVGTLVKVPPPSLR
jgi:hypothetical protein